MKTRVGRLSNRITVQTATIATDSAGNREETWSGETIWAEAKPGGSNRLLDMLQNRIFCDVTFRIRRTSITKKDRIIYDGRICIIEGIRDWEQDQEFQFIETRYSDEVLTVDDDGRLVDEDGNYLVDEDGNYLVYE